VSLKIDAGEELPDIPSDEELNAVSMKNPEDFENRQGLSLFRG
jgi:hypothetical protein